MLVDCPLTPLKNMPTSSLSRFLEAQNKRFAGYQQALTEIKNGY
jgi:hypothetical protein